MADADRCICCGEIIPEGRQVCPQCENGANKNREKKVAGRERLIYLIIHAKKTAPEAGSFTGYLADYLLEHGVIVPPCKIGDTVYINNAGLVCEDRIRNIVYDTGEFAFGKKEVGKTVFFTREKTEQALKERENNG